MSYYRELSIQVCYLYELLLANPQSFAGRGSIEQVVFGIEAILNAVAGTNDRHDSYRRFLQDRGFGMFPFDAKFETNRHCIVAFVDVDKYAADPHCARLHDEYVTEFNKISLPDHRDSSKY